jgi:FKBP-type peptidyl-prolyl cis-trans isomerase
VIPGWQEGLQYLTGAGGTITLLIPSALAYGDAGSSNSVTGATIPPFSCLKFDITAVTVN